MRVGYQVGIKAKSVKFVRTILRLEEPDSFDDFFVRLYLIQGPRGALHALLAVVEGIAIEDASSVVRARSLFRLRKETQDR